VACESAPDRRNDAPRRRCRPRQFDPTGPRPSDLLAAFFSAALVALIAAAVAAIADAVTGDVRLHWLALHLALLGGVSQLVVGAGQFFVCAFLATTPPSRHLVAAQLGAWNSGTLLVAIGVLSATDGLVTAGAALIAAGLGLFATSMRAMQRRSLQRARWAVRWYQASATCLVAGVLVGVLLARGVSWPDGSLLGAHLALNIAGWLGTAIVGTLHTFFPSLTATQLRHPRLQGPTFVLWLLGVVELALAAAVGVDALAAMAWIQLTTAAVLLVVNLLASLRARTLALSLPARLVALGQPFLPAGLAVGLIATVLAGARGPLEPGVRPALAALLAGGWVALTVAGSLLHLLAVLARVRRFTLAMPVARVARDRLVTGLAVLAVTAWALAQVPGLSMLDTPALALRLGATILIAGHIVFAAARAGLPRLHATPPQGDRGVLQSPSAKRASSLSRSLDHRG
jgi:nitrite reductase (NO-forming)